MLKRASSNALVVLDTHTWLWLNHDPALLSGSARHAIEDADAVAVSAMSSWEVGLLVAKGRISLRGGAKPWVERALMKPGVVALPVSPQVAVEAAMLDPSQFPGDPADRIIYATARDVGVSLVTKDARIREYDPRGTVW